jgi:DNA-binding winged helix-turn-helix (wHTH) protein/TolB-like protein
MSLHAKHFYEFGPFRLDIVERLLLRASEPVPLTPKSLDLLLVLVERHGHVVEKQELMQTVWPDTFVEETNLTKNIFLLRQALGEASEGEKYIETIPKRGYRFVAPVREVRDASETEPANLPSDTATATTTGTRARWYSLMASWWLLAGLLGVLLAVAAMATYTRHSVERINEIKSLAVLPFQPLGEQNRNEILEVGLADSLITKLSKIKQLTLRPTSAVLKYAGSEQDPVAIGRTLQVDAVLESRFQQAGDRLKINSQLVRVEDGKVIWSFQSTDLSVDILNLQEKVSESLARDLRFNLTSEEQKLLTRRYTDNAEVYQLYLNGRAEPPKGAREATEKAIDYFQQALAREPNYAPAYSGLADCYYRLVVLFGSPPRSVWPKAKYAAERAIAIDDTLAEAHASLGSVLLSYEWDFVGAKREFERAIELDPKYSPAHKRYADYLTVVGHHEEAIREARLACELDPTSFARRNALGFLLYQAGQYEQAIETADQAHELGQHIIGQGYRYNALVELRRYEEAVEFGLKQEASVGTPQDRIDELRVAFQTGGIRGFWKKEIEQLTKVPRQTSEILRELAYDYAFLGDKDKAFASLEKMVAERDGYLMWLQVDPRWDSLRSDPRFQDLLRRVGLTP